MAVPATAPTSTIEPAAAVTVATAIEAPAMTLMPARNTAAIVVMMVVVIVVVGLMTFHRRVGGIGISRIYRPKAGVMAPQSTSAALSG